MWFSGKKYYWLTLRPQERGATIVSWFNESMPKVKDYFTDINNPTPEELTLFELEFGKEVLDFVFSSNKKLKIQSVEDFK